MSVFFSFLLCIYIVLKSSLIYTLDELQRNFCEGMGIQESPTWLNVRCGLSSESGVMSRTLIGKLYWSRTLIGKLYWSRKKLRKFKQRSLGVHNRQEICWDRVVKGVRKGYVKFCSVVMA